MPVVPAPVVPAGFVGVPAPEALPLTPLLFVPVVPLVPVVPVAEPELRRRCPRLPCVVELPYVPFWVAACGAPMVEPVPFVPDVPVWPAAPAVP